MRPRPKSRKRKRRPVAPVKPASLTGFKPRTSLGHDLLRIRASIIVSGQPALGWKELDRELSRRRGEVAGEQM
jgi:hypothetical protein